MTMPSEESGARAGRIAAVSRAILHAGIALAFACGAPSGASEPSRERPTRPRTAAYAAHVHERFDPERAHATVAYVDRHFRVRGNEGYVKTLERVESELRAAGFARAALHRGSLGAVEPTWTPRSASLSLFGAAAPLIHFQDESERDRACLFVRSDDLAPRELELVRAEAVRTGTSARGRVVLAEGVPARVFEEMVRGAGAAGIVVRYLEPYHRAAEHPDAAQFGYLPEHVEPAFGFSASQRVWETLRAATAAGPARVRVAVDVHVGRSAASSLEARIDGSDRGAGAIVLVAHVDEPGANDNASGVAALAELAGALHRLIEEGVVPRPRRALSFLWGQEIEVSRAWLERPPLPVGAGLVLDMVGQDPAIVGAPFLIERMPDPGAVWLRAPDVHTEWGAGEIDASMLHGHFLNDLAAAAAAEIERADGPWRWRTNPFEGGSDHVPFLERGLPALLAWHFTDSAYHTSLDRLDRVSGREMRRVAAVIGAVALAMASGEEEDALEIVEIVLGAAIERLRSLAIASAVLVSAGRSSEADEGRVRRAWIEWYDEALATVAAWGEGSRALAERVADARRALREEAGAPQR